MPCWGPRLASAMAVSKLRHRLELPDDPALGSGNHENDVVHDGMLVVAGLTAVENLQIVFGRIVQFDDVAFGRIENRVYFVILVEIARGQTTVPLALDGVFQPLVRGRFKQAVQGSGGVRLQGLRQICPGEFVVAKDGAFGQGLDLSRNGFSSIQSYVWSRVGGCGIK